MKHELSVGMYVRTTYGIGKIKNAYIVYDDGGSLWHLAYMTDNPKIEVSIYTKERSWQIFGEVQKDHSIKYESIENNLDLINEVYKQELDEVVCYVPCNNNYPRNAELFDNHKFLKSSFNLIDLIEVGDYVEYKQSNMYWNIPTRVSGRYNRQQQLTELMVDNTPLKNVEITSIVTKELYKSVEYEVQEC